MAIDDSRSKEEKVANTAKIKAETRRIEAETRKSLAEAKTAEVKAEKENLELQKYKESAKKLKASDTENFVYRFNGGVDKNSVIKCRGKLTQWSRMSPKQDLEIVFASPGGSITAGFELFDYIQQLRIRGHKITTGSLGMAASMAGILLQAGERRWIGHQSWILIHRASFGAIGKTFEIEDEVGWVKRIEERIIQIFMSRSNLTKLKIKRNWDRKDWWINADEALELGLVDEVRGILPEHDSVGKAKR
jgi:ATP-dependent Clp endopeptidase proteolytic subunit ClpP